MSIDSPLEYTNVSQLMSKRDSSTFSMGSSDAVCTAPEHINRVDSLLEEMKVSHLVSKQVHTSCLVPHAKSSSNLSTHHLFYLSLKISPHNFVCYSQD